MYLRPFAIGAMTHIPGMMQLLAKKGTGGPTSAAYYYGVWLKHLVMLGRSGLGTIPDTLAELGPGDSLGVGLAAMLCGVNKYYALDVIEFSNPDANVKVFDELLTLFRQRAARPSKGWPDFDDDLDEKLFPSHILTDEVLSASLSSERINLIRKCLIDPSADNGSVKIKYMVPWSEEGVVARESVDVIVSHGVLQSVVDLEGTYRALNAWLKSGGLMSHQIDFTCVRNAKEWNGHWAYGEKTWAFIQGRRPFLLNREPHSTHIALMQKYGFEVVCDLKKRPNTNGIARATLAPRWRNMSDDDFCCSGGFIQARKIRSRSAAKDANWRSLSDANIMTD